MKTVMEHEKQQKIDGLKAMNASEQKSEDEQHTQKENNQNTKEKLMTKWKKNMGSAKETWGKLTDNELLESEGHAEKLALLVHERYAISRAEADTQVKQFIEKCKC